MDNVLITGLNRYLEQDQERAAQLKQIENKVIRLAIVEIKLDVLFTVQGNYFTQLSADEAMPDVEITVALKALPDYLLGSDPDSLIKNGSIIIKGDTHCASVMQNTLKEIEVDWEEIVATYTGDAVAYQLGRGASVLHGFANRLRDNMRQDLRDYLQDSLQVSATQDEVDQFIHDVDRTRAQLDRLEARLNRLQARH